MSITRGIYLEQKGIKQRKKTLADIHLSLVSSLSENEKIRSFCKNFTNRPVFSLKCELTDKILDAWDTAEKIQESDRHDYNLAKSF